mmetsp:Transcript_1580/g.3958  ORF Transcript_1580/g.3958 Transcript_1580/m.3958 type:complete len:427 (+) Transcript_1580:172-1452(+)
MSTCEVGSSCLRGGQVALLTLLTLLNAAALAAVWVFHRRFKTLSSATNKVELTHGTSTKRLELIARHVDTARIAASRQTNAAIKRLAKVRPEAPSLQRVVPRPTPRARRENDWSIEPRELVQGAELAKGSFGVVFRGEWCGIPVAIKRPLKEIEQPMLDKFAEEIEMMIKLHHPNIVMCFGGCVQPKSMFLVLEYLSKGSIHEFLSSKEAERVLTYRMVLKLNIDIARGMRYLHNRVNVIQRDLKSRNLLLDDAYNVKICDFGLSRVLKRDETLTACGTPYWAAPEVVLGEAYDEKADVFSFGIVLWELITRDEPYDGRPGLEVAFAVAKDGLRPRLPPFCPQKYTELMTLCWHRLPHFRPNFTEILENLHEMAREVKEESFRRRRSLEDTLAGDFAAIASTKSPVLQTPSTSLLTVPASPALPGT